MSHAQSARRRDRTAGRDFRTFHERYARAWAGCCGCVHENIPDEAGDEYRSALQELMATRATCAWEIQAKFLVFAREGLDVDIFNGPLDAFTWLGSLMADAIQLAEAAASHERKNGR